MMKNSDSDMVVSFLDAAIVKLDELHIEFISAFYIESRDILHMEALDLITDEIVSFYVPGSNIVTWFGLTNERAKNYSLDLIISDVVFEIDNPPAVDWSWDPSPCFQDWGNPVE